MGIRRWRAAALAALGLLAPAARGSGAPEEGDALAAAPRALPASAADWRAPEEARSASLPPGQRIRPDGVPEDLAAR